MHKENFHKTLLTGEGRIFKPSLIKKLANANLLDVVKAKKPDADIVEAYYWYYYDLTEHPKKCKVCESPLTKFGGFHIGYLHETCSKKCAALDKDRVLKTEKTILGKFGVTHQMHSPSIVKKMQDTCVTRYGVTSGLATDAARYALQQKFGVEHISQSEIWKSKTTDTFNEKYGGRGFSGELGNRGKDTLASELLISDATNFSYQQLAALVSSKRNLLHLAPLEGFELQSFNGETKELILKHKCQEIKTVSLTTPNRLRCFSCHPLKVSSFELEVSKFLEELEVDFHRHDRQLLKPLELDIVIPELKLAIECNGDYWHSFARVESKEERNKHLKKLEAAQSMGYQLMQITEHEWYQKTEQIKSILRVKLGKADVIHGRKLDIRQISSKEANAFCEDNHVQGKAAHRIAIGGFYENALVAVVTAGENRFTKDGSLELIRFSTKLNTVVNGGFSKLIKALRQREIGAIDSYLDRRLFDGHSLIKTGWQLIRTSQPGYCWLYQGQKITRNRAQKHRLAKLLGDKFQPDISEAANMFKAGASRLWDCGQHLYRLS